MARYAWVTGASGFVGGATRHALEMAGWRVDDPKALLRASGRLAVDGRYCSAVLASIPDVPELIVHCAGNSNIRLSIEDPEADLRANYSLVYEWLEYIRNCRCQPTLVFMSTSAVYGNASNESSESSPVVPVSPYGLHKWMAEGLVSYYGRNHGVSAAIIRPLSVYGPGQRKQIIWDALCRFRKKDFYFKGGGANVRDFIYIDDVASFVAYAAAAASKEVPVFNVSTGCGHTIQEAMALLARTAGYAELPYFGDMTWRGDPPVLVGVNDRAKLLGWEPQVSLEDGLKATVRWFDELQVR